MQYDDRLLLPLEFVCKIRGITREAFITSALTNLLYEELDLIKHDYNTKSFPNHNSKEVNVHRKIVKGVQSKADLSNLNNTL